jgi:hypothetical protein
MNIYLKVILGTVILYGLVSCRNSLTSIPETSSFRLLVEPVQVKQVQNLTGVWRCNDGGLYFIRQVGNQVWWYGESGDGGVGWSNVFQGYVTGNKIIGKWADVPKGTARNYGEMTLSISSNSLRKISGGQNFTGSVWSH